MTYSSTHGSDQGQCSENAPTYREEPASETQPVAKRVYKCDVCGYTVECDGELPADFTCPICGVDRSHFKEV